MFDYLFSPISPVGYTNTMSPVNLPAFYSLGDRHWVSNFGMQTQHNIYPDGYDPRVYKLSQNLTSPNHISQWNPMLIGMDLSSGQTIDPALVQKGNQEAADYGRTLFWREKLSMSLNNLTAMEQQLTSLLQSDKLNNSQKSRLQGILDRIKKQKEDIQSKVNDKTSADDLKSIDNQIAQLQSDAAKVGQEVIKDVQDAASKNPGQDGKGGEAAGSVSGEDNTDAPDNNNDSVGNTAKQIREARAKRDKQKKEDLYKMGKVCNDIDKAICGLGTDYDGLKETITKKVNADNVMDLFEAWDNGMAKTDTYKNDKKGLIESLMDDCEFGQKEEIGRMLIDYLEDHAHKLGIDVTSEASKARDSLKSNWIGFRDDDKICDAINALKNKIKQEEAKVNQRTIDDENRKISNAEHKDLERINAETKKKLEEEKKKEALKNAKIQEFIGDIKDITGRDDITSLPSGVKVEVDDKGTVTFTVRKNGKDYTGASFLEIMNAMEADEVDFPLPPRKEHKKA